MILWVNGMFRSVARRHRVMRGTCINMYAALVDCSGYADRFGWWCVGA